ncbi:MAG TPA: phosphoribosylglycinamide formyltransferase [Firmicutes bacterium]|nr:phosphoribosylglycinamide formyltransferase [Bacillota bacterium]
MRTLLKLGILVSGRGSNLQAIIDAIEAGRLAAQIQVVISDRADAFALKRAAAYGIPTEVILREDYPDKQQFEAAIVRSLQAREVELVVLAGFIRLLSGWFLEHFKWRVINIHPSLLPAFPGLNAQAQALEYGVRVSGCTVHFVDEGMDSGPIILQRTVPVLDDDTVETLSLRILEQEHLAYPEAINLIAKGMLRIEGRRVLRVQPSTGEI